jgi:segregation and condensation protein A
MAGELAFRLARLESMRRASTALLARPQLARDVFVRGDPEAIKIVPSVRMEGDLFGLMTAYIEQKRLVSQKQYRPRVVTAYGLDDARRRLKSICVNLDGWTDLTSLLPQAQEAETATPASCLASMLSASLELVKEGDIDLHQEEVFSAVLLRHRGENRA